MAHINRRYIDKHWLVFIFRGGLAAVFGLYILFNNVESLPVITSVISIFLLAMGIIDAISAFFASIKKHGWATSVIDALIDVVTAVFLLFFATDNVMAVAITLAVYTFLSGVIDLFHAFVSTVDPTDRFIRVLSGVIGAVMGFVILNSWHFELTTFMRFFGAYALIVGSTSLVYGVHNQAQDTEDKVARKQARRSVPKKSAKSGVKKVAKKTSKRTRK